jgi:PEP-CTERM motif/Protein tyrosine and serine/threonine kinase
VGAIPTLIPGSADCDGVLPPPERAGAFRLTMRIGRGGMGDVWLGERDDGLYDQKVAVKLIQRHALNRAADAFDDERSFLARLEHPNIAAYSVFNGAGVYNVYDQYSGQGLNPLDFSVLTNTNGISSIITTTIVIPVGETSLGFRAYLNLSARSAASADFGNTARFSVGPLANGLSYNSASGVFLKGLTQTSAVPEPATWGMMLFGFALVGSTLRRRVATRASAPA